MSKQTDNWTFFSNHGHVYFILTQNPNIILRTVAEKVGITERSVLAIVQDLEESGYIKRQKVGRQNTYTVLGNKTLRHPIEKNVRIKDLTELLSRTKA